MDRPIEKEGIAFTAALVDIEDALRGGLKAMREFQRVNMTLNAREYRPLRFDGQKFTVEYEEMAPDFCQQWLPALNRICGSVMHSTAMHRNIEEPNA